MTLEIITFQDICMDKLPKDSTSIKDTCYAALKDGKKTIIQNFERMDKFGHG